MSARWMTSRATASGTSAAADRQAPHRAASPVVVKVQARAFVHAVDHHLGRQGPSIKAAMFMLQVPSGLHTDAGPGNGTGHDTASNPGSDGPYSPASASSILTI